MKVVATLEPEVGGGDVPVKSEGVSGQGAGL